MIYGKYKTSRDAAWQCLIDYEITALPVNVSRIAKLAGVRVVKNKDVDVLKPNELGASYIYDNQWYTAYDDSMSKERSRFTIAHELGHIFLGHETQQGVYYRKFDTNRPENESAADIFASRLLAPMCVLWGIGVQSAEQVARLCEISLKSAQIRYERLEELRKRNKFLTSPLERQVYKNFEQYIQKHKNPR